MTQIRKYARNKKILPRWLLWLEFIFPPQTNKINKFEKKMAPDTTFLEFARMFWEAAEPTIVLTENSLVTRFF